MKYMDNMLKYDNIVKKILKWKELGRDLYFLKEEGGCRKQSYGQTRTAVD
jgi:hypothetical protein